MIMIMIMIIIIRAAGWWYNHMPHYQGVASLPVASRKGMRMAYQKPERGDQIPLPPHLEATQYMV